MGYINSAFVIDHFSANTKIEKLTTSSWYFIRYMIRIISYESYSPCELNGMK